MSSRVPLAGTTAAAVITPPVVSSASPTTTPVVAPIRSSSTSSTPITPSTTARSSTSTTTPATTQPATTADQPPLQSQSSATRQQSQPAASESASQTASGVGTPNSSAGSSIPAAGVSASGSTSSGAGTGTGTGAGTGAGASATDGSSQSQSASSALVPSSSITSTPASSATSATSAAVATSQATSSNERMKYMTVTVTDSSGATQESVISSVGSGSKSGTNVGAIAGGVVGGVVGLLAIIALLWFCVFKKRRTQEDDLDDALFNAGRGQLAAPGQTDILDDEPNNNGVDPYTYQDGRSPQMSQYASQSGYPASVTGTAPSLAPLMATGGAMPLSRNGSYSEASQSAAGGGGAQGITRGPSTASTLTSSGFAGRGAQVPAGQMPYSAYYQAASGAGSYANASSASVAMPLPASAQTQPLTGAQQKAREAAQERPVLRTANPSSSDDYYAPASASGVYVHSDNGRYVPEGEGEEVVDDGPSELPPQYHSIRKE